MNPELTAQETVICRMVADGLTNPEIAAQLELSPYTIKTHVARIFRKTGARGRAQLGRDLAGAGVRYRTGRQVVDILRNLRAERAAVRNVFGSVEYFRQEGEVRILDALVQQIAATENTARRTKNGQVAEYGQGFAGSEAAAGFASAGSEGVSAAPAGGEEVTGLEVDGRG